MKRHIFVIDLDGTLCTNTDGKYEQAKPYLDRINKINRIHKKGHIVIIDTARGSLTKKDWKELTKKQLKEWGVKYNKLKVGTKTFGHIYIDDSAINSKDFFK